MTKKKSITLNELARMMQEQFSETDGKIDNALRVHGDQLEHVRADIRDIKTTLGPLVAIFAQQERKV